jgi:hypothetical protein
MALISDPAVRAELASEWDGVVRMRERMQTLVTGTFAFGAGITAPGVASVVYNLPLLLAFDVLRQVLLAARDQGLFSCRSNHVGPLMDAGERAIPWLEWAELRAGVRRRNEVAHDGKLLSSVECIADIDRVKRQLAEWGVVPA